MPYPNRLCHLQIGDQSLPQTYLTVTAFVALAIPLQLAMCNSTTQLIYKNKDLLKFYSKVLGHKTLKYACCLSYHQ